MRLHVLAFCALGACAGKLETTTSDGCEVLLSLDAEAVGNTHWLHVKAKNVSGHDVTLSLVDRCPAGAVSIAGLPERYDTYGTCNAGPCLASRRELAHRLSAGATAEVALARLGANSECQAPLPPGRYTLSPVAPQNALRLCTLETTLVVTGTSPVITTQPVAPVVTPPVVTPPPVVPPPTPKHQTYSRTPIAKEYACQNDADCTLVCPEVKTCCGNPCGCSHAMNRAFAEAYTRDYAKWCDKPPKCPAMGCAYKPAYGASCHEGRCVAQSGPGGF